MVRLGDFLAVRYLVALVHGSLSYSIDDTMADSGDLVGIM